MSYRRFLGFSVAGGVAWVAGFLSAGYWFGNLPAVKSRFHWVIVAIILVSVLVAHTGWHWMLERGAELAKFQAPRLDALFLASLMRGCMAVLVLAALVWAARERVRRWIDERKA